MIRRRSPRRSRIGNARAKVRLHVWGLITAGRGGIPAAKAAGSHLGDVIVVRLDSAIVVAHSDKQQARGTFQVSCGHHPLTAWCDNTGEALAVPATRAAIQPRTTSS